MRSGPTPLDRRADLEAIVRSTPWFMAALVAARSLKLPAWCIGAGAVRNLVWDRLQASAAPSALPDVDVAYFDPDEAFGRERVHQAALVVSSPEVPWEVTNQAHVHRWFEDHFGHPVRPLGSIEDAVSTWPEFATCVGVHLGDDDRVGIVAPHGLDDLFAMRIRRNPARVSVETFHARVAEKRYRDRWPQVEVVAA